MPPGRRRRPDTSDRRGEGSRSRHDRATPGIWNITENLAVLLTQNVPIVVARSADAASDRTVTVEVKAEILK